MVTRMSDEIRLTCKQGKWYVMARKGALAATEAAWVSLGGCTSQVVAVRLWLALQAREKHE